MLQSLYWIISLYLIHVLTPMCVCVDSGFVRKIKIGNYEISSEMILSTALLVVGPI